MKDDSIAQKNAPSEASRIPVRERWKDGHYHRVIRSGGTGRFVSTSRWHPPIVFGSELQYAYVVKISDGSAKGKITMVSSNQLLKNARRGTWKRKAIYAAIREKYFDYDFEIRKMHLMSTYDTHSGKQLIPTHKHPGFDDDT